MSSSYDALVIGAGHNGLITAALLARGGRRVLVLEQGSQPGGLAASEEFHPGYRSAGVLPDTGALRPAVVRDLELERHGLRLRGESPSMLAFDLNGDSLLLSGDTEQTARALERRSARDASRYSEYRELLERLRPALTDFVDQPALDLVDARPNLAWVRRGLGVRRLGRRTMLELLRLPPVPVADLLSDWFEDGLLKAALALPALRGGFVGPRAPGTTFGLLLEEGLRASWIAGGAPALIQALLASGKQHGVELRCEHSVEQVLIERGRVRGVALTTGESIEAPLVAAACHPRRLLLDLIDPRAIDTRLESRAGQIRSRGVLAHLLVGVSRSVAFTGANDTAPAHARLVGDLDTLERGYDAVKYRQLPETPPLEVHIPSLDDPSLAPEGHAVVSVLVHGVPGDPEPAWDEASRAVFCEQLLDRLDRILPGLAGSVAGTSLRTPADLERQYALPGGHLYHGEHAMDQLLVRPLPECVGHATPVAGLFLCSAGSHPGGGLTGAPGRLAAAAMLR